MSQEELKARTTLVMKEKGANYHFQAQFYEATSREVVGSSAPKFCSLQPTIKPRTGERAWAQAYEFIYDYLETLEMRLALQTLGVELRKAPNRPSSGAFGRQDRDEYFATLLRIKHPPLQAEVKAFATAT
jgi:hypothetical protein